MTHTRASARVAARAKGRTVGCEKERGRVSRGRRNDLRVAPAHGPAMHAWCMLCGGAPMCARPCPWTPAQTTRAFVRASMPPIGGPGAHWRHRPNGVCVLTDDSQSGIISTIVSVSISEASQHSTVLTIASPIGPVRVTWTVRSASKSLIRHRNPVHFTQAPHRPIDSL